MKNLLLRAMGSLRRNWGNVLTYAIIASVTTAMIAAIISSPVQFNRRSQNKNMPLDKPCSIERYKLGKHVFHDGHCIVDYVNLDSSISFNLDYGHLLKPNSNIVYPDHEVSKSSLSPTWFGGLIRSGAQNEIYYFEDVRNIPAGTMKVVPIPDCPSDTCVHIYGKTKNGNQYRSTWTDVVCTANIIIDHNILVHIAFRHRSPPSEKTGKSEIILKYDRFPELVQFVIDEIEGMKE